VLFRHSLCRRRDYPYHLLPRSLRRVSDPFSGDGYVVPDLTDPDDIDLVVKGRVGIGTDVLSSGVRLSIGGGLDVNGNKIINVGSPMKDSDVATKK